MKNLIVILFIAVLPAAALSQSVESVVVKPRSDRIADRDIGPADLVSPVIFRSLDPDRGSPFVHTIRTQPGLAFLSSAIVPGSSQAFNRNWIRAGLFAAIEVTAIVLAIDYQKRGSRGERIYERNADQSWSVVQYAQWLVEYHDIHNLSNPYIEDLRDEISGIDPAFDPEIDWSAVDLNLLRSTEQNTRYITTDDHSANYFSHILPAYGSQQYYELIAKYYQYQAGWKDYHDYHDQLGHTGVDYNQRYLFNRNGAYASPLFRQFAADAERFNDLYRTGHTFKMLLIANHIASAFDAYFTVHLKQNRIEATPSVAPGRQISMTVRF